MTSELKPSIGGKVVLHLGMPKCGSSALQRELIYLCQDTNVSQYLMYPSPENHSGVLTRAFCGDQYNLSYHGNIALRMSLLEAKQEGARYAAMLKDLASNNPGKSLVLSSEDILFWSLNDIQRLLDFCLDLYPELVVIIYVREPRVWITSVFAERVRHCIVGEPAFEEIEASLSIYSTIEYLASALPRLNSRCVIVPYQDVFSSNSISEHFLGCSGLADEVVAAACSLVPGLSGAAVGGKVNLSLSLLSLKIAWNYLSKFPRDGSVVIKWDAHFRIINYFQSIADARIYRFSPAIDTFEHALAVANHAYAEFVGVSEAVLEAESSTGSSSYRISSRSDLERFSAEECELVESFLRERGYPLSFSHDTGFGVELATIVHRIFRESNGQ